MAPLLRVLLIIGSVFALVLCIRKIRHAKFKNSNAIIWVSGCILLVFMSCFPNIIVSIASKIGFISPANLVFMIVITFLLIQVMLDNVSINELNNKVKDLDHYIALMEHKDEEDNINEKN